MPGMLHGVSSCLALAAVAAQAAPDAACTAAGGVCSSGPPPQGREDVLLQTGSVARRVDGAFTPHALLSCPGDAVMQTPHMTADKYDQVAGSVVSLLNGLDTTCNAKHCEQADWAGCVLRMAGHDFMDYKDGVGGSDACTDMRHMDNVGLSECLHRGEHGVSLEQAYQEHCTEVSLADFLVIAAEAVMVQTRKNAGAHVHMIPFRDNFRYGRKTGTHCEGAPELLPNPLRGCDAVEETFVNNLGLTWRAAAALMGVHSLGRARIENSGFHGWWSDPVNSRIFNNDYYISLMAKGWVPETSVNGVEVKSQWGRSDKAQDRSFDGHEMMLDTDMCLAYSENGRPINSQETDCCAWVDFPIAGARCGSKRDCCVENRNDCGIPLFPRGPAARHVLQFARNEDSWLSEFAEAWTKVTENGHAGLSPLAGLPPGPAPAPSPGSWWRPRRGSR